MAFSLLLQVQRDRAKQLQPLRSAAIKNACTHYLHLRLALPRSEKPMIVTLEAAEIVAIRGATSKVEIETTRTRFDTLTARLVAEPAPRVPRVGAAAAHWTQGPHPQAIVEEITPTDRRVVTRFIT